MFTDAFGCFDLTFIIWDLSHIGAILNGKIKNVKKVKLMHASKVGEWRGGWETHTLPINEIKSLAEPAWWQTVHRKKLWEMGNNSNLL